MAAPRKPDNTWVRFVLAGYYEDALGPACTYCDPELTEAEERKLDDTATSPLNDALRTWAAAPRNDAPGTSQRRSEFPNTGRRRKEKTGKECMYVFCIPCKEGGLCVNEFLDEDSPHPGHPCLHIFRVNNQTCVRKQDMAGHLDTISVMATSWNNHTLQRLRTAKASNSETDVMHCEGCQKNVDETTSMPIREENERNARVCSIQCLLLCRERQFNFTGARRPKQLRPSQIPPP